MYKSPSQLPEEARAKIAEALNARLADEKDPLHEDLKYRYLASALVITKDDPFTLGAEKKVAYFDELLKEIHLQARVDGLATLTHVTYTVDNGHTPSVIGAEALRHRPSLQSSSSAQSLSAEHFFGR